MKRHKTILQLGKGYKVASDRTEWVNYTNIDQMYDLEYEQMIKSGIAVALPESDWYYINDEGEKVDCEKDAVGHLVKVEITHPEWLLFGDEVGTEMSMKDDGHIGGTKYVTAKGTRANIKSSHKNGRFTVIGLTAASGDAVMCIVIFAAEELTFAQRMGYDIRAPYDDSKSITENSGRGKAFPGAPTCLFRGKQIPDLIAVSPKGSITSEILNVRLKN